MRSTDSIIRAIELLDDPTAADTTLLWWRRGKNGYIHTTRHCWKSRDWSTLDSLHMTVRAAAKSRLCLDCFDRGNNIPDLSEALKLASIEASIKYARTLLDGRAADDVSAVIELAARAREDLQDMKSFNTCETAHRQLTDQARQLVDDSLSDIHEAQESIIRRAAISLAEVDRGRRAASLPSERSWAYLGATESQVTRLSGNTHALTGIHDEWVNNILSGGSPQDAFKAAATEMANRIDLYDVGQLQGVPLDCPPGSDAREVVKAAWHKQVHQDITDLCTLWQSEYEKNLAQRDTTTMGVTYDWHGRIQDRDVAAALRSFPHAQGASGFIGNYPEVVALWLAGTYDRQARRSSHTAADLAVLETAAALWDASGDGAYRRVSDAVEAAANL